MIDSLLFFVLCGLGVFSIIALPGILLWWFMTGRDHRKRTLGIVLVLAVSAIGLVILGIFLLKPPVGKDLRLDGGYLYTLEVRGRTDDNGSLISVTPDAVDQAVDTLEARLEQIGQDDVFIQKLGSDRIRIEISGAEIDEAEVLDRIVVEPARLELRSVHPESASKAPLVREGEMIVPGHVYYEYRFSDRDGEEITEDLLLSKRVQVEGKHVKHAAPDASQKGVVNIRLSGEGGDRMILLTKNMTPGRDRIAVVLDDKVLSAPVVRSVPLGSSFIIEGLDDYQEANDLAASLMNPLVFPIEILEATHVSPAQSGTSPVSFASGSRRRLKLAVGVDLGVSVLVLGGVVLGVIALGSKRSPAEANNQSPPSIPGPPPPRDPA